MTMLALVQITNITIDPQWMVPVSSLGCFVFSPCMYPPASQPRRMLASPQLEQTEAHSNSSDTHLLIIHPTMDLKHASSRDQRQWCNQQQEVVEGSDVAGIGKFGFAGCILLCHSGSGWAAQAGQVESRGPDVARCQRHS